MAGRDPYGTPLERFEAKVERTPTCWLWRASLDHAGYGRFKSGRHQVAHRWSYEHFVGPIPEGLQIDHLCRTPACVNPEHLEPVTGAENVRRAFAHITHCPQRHPYSAENTYKRAGDGRRYCRECRRARGYAWREAHPRTPAAPRTQVSAHRGRIQPTKGTNPP